MSYKQEQYLLIKILEVTLLFVRKLLMTFLFFQILYSLIVKFNNKLSNNVVLILLLFCCRFLYVLFIKHFNIHNKITPNSI
ncbi:hypothetical protein Mgra_00006979 [Meloidogyne graminicola]|uniref:Uncharacterized protein n=1 Tax=Meloidogyne graminicola TaxID=189291 RepID=A0A8S9ZK71_9BILA|nr:hypothetical protein Mgra_00006979 [Meloidogyne graminicola]